MVVTLGRDVVVLKILFAVEGDLLGLDLAVLDLYLVPREDDGDVLAHPGKVAVPVGDVLVGDARRDVKHDDGALPLDAAGRGGRSQAGELCVSLLLQPSWVSGSRWHGPH